MNPGRSVDEHRRRSLRRTVSAPAVLGVVVGVLSVLVGCDVGAPAPAEPGAATASGSPRATGSSGLRTCALSSLPTQAATVVETIHRGGPYRYPRNDGVVFGNRERVLPSEPNGWYHEYTVVTPGASTRGARRIVTGGRPLTDPPSYFYTGDHYDSFCEITGAAR